MPTVIRDDTPSGMDTAPLRQLHCTGTGEPFERQAGERDLRVGDAAVARAVHAADDAIAIEVVVSEQRLPPVAAEREPFTVLLSDPGAADSEPELFWALRGGAAPLGVCLFHLSAAFLTMSLLCDPRLRLTSDSIAGDHYEDSVYQQRWWR